jgi:hypothetical protein
VKPILGAGVDEITIIPFGDEATVVDRFAKDVMERI